MSRRTHRPETAEMGRGIRPDIKPAAGKLKTLALRRQESD